MIPEPVPSDHAPVPIDGLFAFKLTEEVQTETAEPAIAVDGELFITFTVAFELQRLLVTVHLNVFIPLFKFETDEL